MKEKEYKDLIGIKNYWKPPCLKCTKIEDCANQELSRFLGLECKKFLRFIKEQISDIENKEVI